MTSKNILLVLSSILVLGSPLSLLAKEQVKSPYSRVIEGASDPEALSVNHTTRPFLKKYKGQLDTQLSMQDRKILLNAIRDVAWMEGVYFALQPIHNQNTNCELLKNGASAVKIAESVENFEKAHKERINEILTNFLTSLSVDGLDVVRSHIDTFIAPVQNQVDLDLVGMVSDDPAEFMSNIESACINSPKLKGEFRVEETVKPTELGISVETIKGIR